MDHFRFLALVQELHSSLTQIKTTMLTRPARWCWAVTAVLFPESKCPFCKQVVQSQGVWLLVGPNERKLLGMITVKDGARITILFPGHPHNMGGGALCLGSHANGIELLGSMPNLSDCPMGDYNVPAWLKRYWNHTCQESRDYLGNEGNLLQELDNTP